MAFPKESDYSAASQAVGATGEYGLAEPLECPFSTNGDVNSSSMRLSAFTNAGVFFSWRLLKAAGVIAGVLLALIAFFAALMNQSFVERRASTNRVALAISDQPSIDGIADKGDTDGTGGTSEVQQLAALASALSSGLEESHAALVAIMQPQATDKLLTRLELGQTSGWSGVDPLFAPFEAFSGTPLWHGEGVILAENVLSDGVLAMPKLNLDQLLESNQALLDRAANALSNRTYVYAQRGEDQDGLMPSDPNKIQLAQQADLAQSLVELERLIGQLSEDKNRLKLNLTASELAKRNSELRASQLQSRLTGAQSSLRALEDELEEVAADRLRMIQELGALETTHSELQSLASLQAVKLEDKAVEILGLKQQIARRAQNNLFYSVAGGSEATTEALELTRGVVVAAQSEDEKAGDQRQVRDQLALAAQRETQDAAKISRLTIEISALRRNLEQLKQDAVGDAVAKDGGAESSGSLEVLTASDANASALAGNSVESVVGAAIVQQSLETATAQSVLQNALADAKSRIDDLEMRLSASIVDQRFAETEFSRVQTQAERLATLLEEKTNRLTTFTNLQDQLYRELSLRYDGILTNQIDRLGQLYPEALDLRPSPVSMWDTANDIGEDLGGALFVTREEADEFSAGFNMGDVPPPVRIPSSTLEFAVALDQSLSGIEALMSVSKTLPFGPPVEYTRVSSHYGPRRNPVTQQFSNHYGIDLAAAEGTAVRVQSPGKVVFAGWKGGFGRFVEIEHENGVVTRYAHLRRILVELGQVVETNEQVGEVGSSGRSTGPHLHYEIQVQGVRIDPREWIKARLDVLPQ